MNKLIYFAHGKESGPWGDKIKALAQIGRNKGWQVESPDYSFTMDPEIRVNKLLSLRPEAEELVLVGSSMGGYVSTVSSAFLKVSGLFFWRRPFISKVIRNNPPGQAPREFVSFMAGMTR